MATKKSTKNVTESTKTELVSVNAEANKVSAKECDQRTANINKLIADNKVKLEELDIQLNDINSLYNELLSGDANDPKILSQLTDTNKKMEDIEKEYAETASKIAYDICRAEKDPMLEAIKRLNYQVKNHKDSIDNDGIITREITTKNKDIELLKLHEKVKGGIGVDKNWHSACAHFNKLLTLKYAKMLCMSDADIKKIDDSYAMSKNISAYNLGEDPTGDKNIKATLTLVIRAMIGGNHDADNSDQFYFERAWTKKSKKALTLVAANHKQNVRIFQEVCNRIITNGKYGLECKLEKDK